MPPRNLICLVVDRLQAAMIGAYGNSWIRTLHLDQLASQSFVFDQAVADSPDLAQLYRAYWLGIPAVDRQEAAEGATLPGLLQAAGIHTALVTDEPAVSAFSGAADFAERVFIESVAHPRSAGDISETQLARLFGAASAWLESAPRPFFLWVHARAMAAPWDAPWEMRLRYADDEDPRPPDFVDVPNRWLLERADPDEVLGIQHAYAGQVALLDDCLGGLLTELDELGLTDSTALGLLTARGFPLGEHRRVGPCDEPLYAETTALGWMMRFPDGLGRLNRSQALARPADLPGTLLEYLQIDASTLGHGRASSLLGIIRGEVESLRDRLGMVSQGERGLRTPAWWLRQPNAGAVELYAKPSDRGDVNEVSKLCPEIVVGLQAALAEPEPRDIAPLSPELVSEMD